MFRFSILSHGSAGLSILLTALVFSTAGSAAALFDPPQRAPLFEPVDSLEYMDFFRTADLDGDGFGDITGRSGSTGALCIVSRGENGSFTKVADFDGYGENAPAIPMDTGDGDGDGGMEILAYAGSFDAGARIQVWEASGAESFPSVLTWELDIPAKTCCLARYGDLDGDGLAEIAVLEKSEDDPFFSLDIYECAGDDTFEGWSGNPFCYPYESGTPGDMTIFSPASGGSGGVLIMWYGYSCGSFIRLESDGGDSLRESISGFDLGYMVFCSGRLNLLPGGRDPGFRGGLLFGAFTTDDSYVFAPSSIAGYSRRWRVPDGCFWKSNDAAVPAWECGGDVFVCNAARGQYLCRAGENGDFNIIWERKTAAAIVLPYCIALCDLDRNGRGEIILSEWDNSGGRLLVLEEPEP